MIKPIDWRGDHLRLLDQRKLPAEETYVTCAHWREVADAIRDMVVRGAPAIGITAAYGYVLGARALGSLSDTAPLEKLKAGLYATRPTAVNLGWALDRMHALATESDRSAELRDLEALAERIEHEDREMCERMGHHGADFLGKVGRVLTHCNTGALATGGAGTALAVIREMHRRHPLDTIYVDETRPYLQGSRLTAWELYREELPACLITDSMAGHMMKCGRVDAVVVGADRIARNGDVANKIGTYSLAVLCHHHKIPFVVVAPTSTYDPACATGEHIEIENRPLDELKFVGDVQISPSGVQGENPSFDVTPNHLITAIITEVGIVQQGEFERLAQHHDLSESKDFG